MARDASPHRSTGRRILRALLYAVGALAILVVVLAGTRKLARSRTAQLFGDIVARVETVDSVVALSFDDGPVDGIADTLIRVLGDRGVRATFFVMGAGLAEAPEAARRLVAAGHELGNHTYDHRRMVLKSPSFVRDQIERTDALIRAAGHEGPIHFRPPYGYKLAVLPWYLRSHDRTTVTWDVEPDSYPAVAETAEGIVAHVVERVRPGSIIILHPWYPSRRTSLAAIGPLVDSLQARGYRVTTVNEVMRQRARGRRRTRLPRP